MPPHIAPEVSDFGAYEPRHDLPALVCWVVVCAVMGFCVWKVIA